MTHKMTGGASKRKGSAFERDVARKLSSWLTSGQDDTQIIRSVLSGGWSRGNRAAKDAWRHVGDLAPNGPVGEQFRRVFAVECKHRRAVDLYGLWTGKRSDADILGWWDKLCKDADAAGVRPMLVFRPNRLPTMLGMRCADMPALHAVAECGWHDLSIAPFDKLLERDGATFLADFAR